MTRPKPKDTMFRDLFKEPSRFISLLEKCRGERVTLSESEIIPFDLDSDYVVRLRRNDVSFLAEGRIIILVEHQSTINPNMALRLFLYYNELLQLWIELNKIDLYGREKVKNLPLPEFYVAYNGKEALKEEYSTFRTHHEGIKIEVNVKIVDVNYSKLEDNSPQNPLAGYAFFHSKYDEGIERGLSRQDAFENATQACIKSKYLTGYIEKEDFIMFYKNFLDYDRQLISEAKAEGREEGREEGKEEGLLFAIKSNAPLATLEGMAKLAGIPQARLDELIRQEQGVMQTA